MPPPRARIRTAGKRQHQITFQAISYATQDASGAAEDAATTLASVWASIHPLTGGESWLPPQVVGRRGFQILCDYVAGLTTQHRIKFGARTFDITLIRNLDEINAQYEIFASEAV